MKYSNNVLAFSQTYGLSDLLEAFSDYYNHYKAEIMGKKTIYNEKLSFSEKTKTLHENIEATVSKMSGVQNMGFSEAVYRTNPSYKWACFAVVGSMIDAVIADSVNDGFGRFSEIRNGGFGDSFTFDIKPNDLFVVTKAGNGKRHAFAQRQFNGQATLIPETRMVTVEEDLYRVLSGKRNLAEYAIKCAMSMEEEMANDIYNAINDTYSTLPTQFKEASFTQTTFIQLAQRIKAFNGGASVSAFGTQVALSSVLPSNEYLKVGLGQEYTRNGFIGNFMGVSCHTLDQKATWGSSTYATKIDDTRIYLVSSSHDKLVKVGIEGDTLSFVDESQNNATLVQKQTLQKRWKAGLISNAHFGIIDLS